MRRLIKNWVLLVGMNAAWNADIPTAAFCAFAYVLCGIMIMADLP